MNTSYKAPATEVEFPGHPGLTLKVYGVAKARGFQEEQARGFFVSRDGTAIPRCEQTQAEQAVVLDYLTKNFPEHAQLITGATA